MIIIHSQLNPVLIGIASMQLNEHFSPINKQISSLIILHDDRFKEIYLLDKPEQLKENCNVKTS